LLYFGTTARIRPGLLTGVFAAGYAVARLFVELFREPDAHLGFLAGRITMGQVLSIPLLLFGIFLIWRAVQRAPLAPAQ
jgi:phosphatidylglycerol:prolipoprotein diacylglycerol transferase